MCWIVLKLKTWSTWRKTGTRFQIRKKLRTGLPTVQIWQGSSTVNTVILGGGGQMHASPAGRPSDWSSWHVYGRADRPVDRAFALSFPGRTQARVPSQKNAKLVRLRGATAVGYWVDRATASAASYATAMRRRATSQWRFCRRLGGLSLRRSLHWPALVEIKDGRRAAASPAACH